MGNDMLCNVWPEWQVVRRIGRGSFGAVYEVIRTDHAIQSRAAVKVISIPQDRSEIASLIAEGRSKEETRSYLEGIVKDFTSEIQIMESLKGVQNIVGIEDYKLVEKRGELGWNIYIRMELLKPLNDYIYNKKMQEQQVIKLGVDICSALELCAKRNVIHRDIKPENIFINQFDDFKLGDFGIARELENVAGSLSRKGTYNYMAPEVWRGDRSYNATVDLYSLGLVLYRFANDNRLPFLSKEQMRDPNEYVNAMNRRLSGERLPPPCNASPALSQAILCACAYRPGDRFASAEEMKSALTYAAGHPYLDHVSGGTVPFYRKPSDRTVHVPQPPPQPPPTAPTRRGKKRLVLPVISALLALAVVIAGIVWSHDSGTQETKEPSEPPVSGEAENSGSVIDDIQQEGYDTRKINMVIGDAEKLAGTGDYEGALAAVEAGLASFPDSPGLLAKKDAYTRLLQEKNGVLAEAAGFRNNGDYPSAIRLLEDAMQKHSGDTDYQETCRAYCEEYKAKAIADADKLASEKNYTAAIHMLEEVVSVIGEDAEVTQKIGEYQAAQAADAAPGSLPYIDPASSGLYEDALFPDLYYSWEYDDSMKFSYPGALYQTVSAVTEPVNTLNGYNEVSYEFRSTGLEHRTLMYQKIKNIYGISDEAMCRDWYNYRMSSFTDGSAIIYKAQGPNPRYVITGYGDWSKSWTVYEVGSAENNCFYRMVVIMPTPVNAMEEQQRNYITECLYRRCSFSGGFGPCRSFEDFLS